MVLLSTLLVTIILGSSIWYTITWFMHRNEAIGYGYGGTQYGFATFQQFLNQFNKCVQENGEEMGIHIDYCNDIIVTYNSYKEKANINYSKIEFDGKFMIITFWEYWQFLWWKFNFVRNYKTNKINKNMIQW